MRQKEKNIFLKIFKVFFLKKNFLIEFLFYLPSSLILVLLTRIVNIFKKVKFLPVDFSRIANIYPLFWYLKVNQVINVENNCLKLFFVEDKFKHNRVWLTLWNRKMKFLSFYKVWKNFFFLSKFIPGHKKIEIAKYDESMHNLYLSKKNQKQISYFKNKIKKISNLKKTFIKFNENETIKGNKYLKSIGTKELDYICFHARDEAYLKDYDKKKDWNYHNFRNSNIDNYLLAIEYLTKKGHQCLRMGSKVEKKIQTANPKILDYAVSSAQSDFLDVYLGSKCLMAVYSESGISIIPEVFNRPIVYVNWPALNFSCFNSNSLVIPKKFFSKKKNRLLNFREILELNFENNFRTEKLKNLEIDLIENTPDEILCAVTENYRRINGNWEEDSEAVELQKKFWDIFKYDYIKSSTFRIGTDFLKKNQNLIQ